MIEPDDLDKIKSLTEQYWHDEVKGDRFRAMFAGKEIGHRIADDVDERTTAMLRESFDVASELDAKGEPRARSMGDLWLYSGGMYNPINVKAGEADKRGKPNLVSMRKLLDALLGRQIDSYYLLIVKMRLEPRPASEEGAASKPTSNTITPNVYLVDMLDYLDFVNFDAGTGQTMLKEEPFYAASENGISRPSSTIADKIARLIDMSEDGDRRLKANRKRTMEQTRTAFERYKDEGEYAVDQEGLNFGSS